mmetsp:Transcript_69646/g.193845  ORF Transcript_69646/g.193845 Transcript_69646/m.193845 type:complete len:230 (+) Transcript_69646:2-691(+)
MHCDIKEPNLMLKTPSFEQPEVVVIDFGVARAMTASDATICGTPGYIPPETWERGKWFPRGDVFSMGVCIVQLMTNKLPPVGPRTPWTEGGIFVEGALTNKEIAAATRQRQPPFHLMPLEFKGLIRVAKDTLQKEMHVRPTPVKVLSDAWFQTDGAGYNATVHKQTSSPRSRVRPRNEFATVGITKSFIASMDAPTGNAAVEGLLEVTRAANIDAQATKPSVVTADPFI